MAGRLETELDPIAAANAARIAERNREAAAGIRRFAKRNDKDEAWIAETLDVLGLTGIDPGPPGICRAPGCGKAISITTTGGAKVGRGYCSNTCLRADQPIGATS